MPYGILIKAFRPVNLVMAAFVMLAVRYGIAGIPFFRFDLSFLFFSLYTASVLCVMAFGYLINDFYDVETDTINKPGKNIFGNARQQNVRQLLIWLPVAGVVIPASINLAGFPAPTTLNALVLLLLLIYAKKGKNSILWGNVLIALLSAMLVYAALLASQNDMPFSSQTYWKTGLYAVFSFLATLVREIVKDAEDREGDQKAGIKTLATEKNINHSKIWGSVFLWITQALILVAAWLLYTDSPLLPIAFGSLAIIGFFILFKIRKSYSKDDFTAISNWLKVYMALGITTMFL